MAKQTVNIGVSANDRTGDNLRTAFNKINENFTELYTALGLDEAPLNLGAFEFTGSTLTTTDSSAITIAQNLTVTNDITVGGDIVPNVTEEHNLGSSTLRFKDLYLSGSTIDLGGTTLSVVDGALQVGGAPVVSQSDLTGYVTQAELAAGSITVNATGDIQGSVFADDSTMLVDAVAGKIVGDIEKNGILTLRTTDNDMRFYAADDFYFEAGEGANDFTVNAGLIELGGNVELDGTLTFPDSTSQSTAYVERFVNRSRFTGNATVTSGSANLLQFDAYQGSQAFIGPTYQWTPAHTGLYRLDFVLGLTGSEVDLDLIVFLYNVTANTNQIQLYNGTFTGSVLSMSGTVYLMAGQNFQFGIIQTSGGDITLDSQLTSAGIEELARLS